MSAYTTIARPYAKAAFEFAVEHKAIEVWQKFLNTISFIVSNEFAHRLFQSPEIDAKKKRAFLEDICGKHINAEQKNLLATLTHFNRLLIIPTIAQLFHVLVKEHDNLIDVVVTSAFALSEGEKDKLTNALQIRLGKTVKINNEEDKSLIGGAVIRAGNFVIDGSVKGKLKRLSKVLA